jgi:hypothetical protein
MSDSDIRDIVAQSSLESPPKLVLIDLVEFLAISFPPREMILTPWLPKAGLCMIHAFRGVGKTHLSLGIAYAVATGGEFLGWKAPLPRKVLFVDGEMPASVLQERLARIINISGNSSLANQLKIITPDKQLYGFMPDIGTLEGQQLLNAFIPHDVDLIILDNLSCLAPSIKENDSSDWAIIQTWVLRQRAIGRSVLMVHHSGKAGHQRGTSRREDVLDTVIGLERPKDYEPIQGARFVVKYEKARDLYGDAAKPFVAHLIGDGAQASWQVKAMEESTFDRVCVLTNEGYTQSEIVEKLGINKSNVSRHLKHAREEGLIHCTPKCSTS